MPKGTSIAKMMSSSESMLSYAGLKTSVSYPASQSLSQAGRQAEK